MEQNTELCQERKVVLRRNRKRGFVLLVDVILDWQQVVAHSLEGQLMQDRRHGVKRPIQDDQLGTSLVRTLRKGD